MREVMIDQLEAQVVELAIDETGKVWVNIDDVCVARVGNVATLQLRLPNNRYISHTKSGTTIARRHECGNCWCGSVHGITAASAKTIEKAKGAQ
jgi:hypothetical protein